MSEAIKPTPGECRYTPRAVDESGNWASRIPFAIEIAVGAAVIPVADVCAQPQAEANAALITEAFNVHNTTSLAPRQLVERVKELEEALKLAEAGLADIGDADREPGDDLAWCERRAAEPLPRIRAALSKSLPNTVAEVK